MCVRESERERERERERLLWTIPSPCEVDLIHSSISLRAAFHVDSIQNRYFTKVNFNAFKNCLGKCVCDYE